MKYGATMFGNKRHIARTPESGTGTNRVWAVSYCGYPLFTDKITQAVIQDNIICKICKKAAANVKG